VTEIVYFGLIRPEKGLEAVLQLANLLHKSSLNCCVRIIGSPDPRMLEYYEKLRLESHGLPVIWDVGLDDGSVGKALARARIAYLPFPDGASERRSSLLACLANGVVTVSTQGKFTTKELSKVILPSSSPSEAFQLINTLIMDMDMLDRFSMRGKAYIENHSWDKIVNKYTDIYEKSIQSK
jgi:glycosyltransferase involved in cell wall biosynthesis